MFAGNFLAIGMSSLTSLGVLPLADIEPMTIAVWVIVPLLLLMLAGSLVGLRYIPNDRVGVIEKLWSGAGSV